MLRSTETFTFKIALWSSFSRRPNAWINHTDIQTLTCKTWCLCLTSQNMAFDFNLSSSYHINLFLMFTHHTHVHMSAHALTPATVNPEGCFCPRMCPSVCTCSLRASAFACVSECGVILNSARCGLRAEPTWCDIYESREIIYMTLPLIGLEILI